MAFRFRRSIRIAPGVRLNVGKRGTSLSAGVRGASVTFGGKRGTHANLGIPGTGVSYRTRIDGARSQRQAERMQRQHERLLAQAEEQERLLTALSSVTLKLQADGTLDVVDGDGVPLERKAAKIFWDTCEADIRSWLELQAQKINGEIDFGTIHHDTPSPDVEPEYEPLPFEEESPERPSALRMPSAPSKRPVPQPNLLLRIFPGVRRRYREALAVAEAEYRQAAADHDADVQRLKQQQDLARVGWQDAMRSYEDRRTLHELEQRALQESFPDRIRTDLALMEQSLDAALNGLDWPRETLVSYELREGGSRLWLDVDLPEIEDLPQQEARLAANCRRLLIKDRAQKALQQEYAAHIHAIVLRLIGYAFATLPALQEVIASGYSQRLNKATGHTDDDYLLSVRVDRHTFAGLNFDGLEAVDPVEAIGTFENRRLMSATAMFKAIEPIRASGEAAEAAVLGSLR